MFITLEKVVTDSTVFLECRMIEDRQYIYIYFVLFQRYDDEDSYRSTALYAKKGYGDVVIKTTRSGKLMSCSPKAKGRLKK